MGVTVSDQQIPLQSRRAQALARLAVLQRLREQADKGDRASMFCAIDQMMAAERQVLMTTNEPESKSQD